MTMGFGMKLSIFSKKKTLIPYFLMRHKNVLNALHFKITVDPQFCPPSTCSIKYLFGTLWQFPGGPLLLM